MKKQKTQMLVLLGILVLFIIGFFAVQQYNKVQSEKPEEETGVIVAELNADDIVKLSYDYEGVSYSFEKEGDTWYVAGDHSVNLIQSSIQSMVNGIASLTADTAIENVTDMSQYGLDSPERTITVETASESLIFEVGDQNSVSGGYYICKPSETTVYLVEDVEITRFNRTLEDLEETEEETVSTETEAAGTESAETEAAGTESTETEAAETVSTETGTAAAESTEAE